MVGKMWRLVGRLDIVDKAWKAYLLNRRSLASDDKSKQLTWLEASRIAQTPASSALCTQRLAFSS